MGPNETKFKNIPNAIKQYKTPNTPLVYYLHSYRFIGAMEIYINDMPYKKYYNGDNTANYENINDYILKSGEQTIRVRYIGEGEPLRKDFLGKITIKESARDQGLSNSREVIKYKTPEIYKNSEVTKEFVGAGKMVYEDSFTFDATVPYEFVGWSESEDLTKLKPEQLEKEALAAYQNIIDICKRKDREALFGLFYQSEFEKAQSKYYDEKIFKKFTAGYNFILEDSSVKFLPLENYKVHLYADGKVVALESIIHEGEPALCFNNTSTDSHTGDKFDITSYFKILLHKPKGSNKLVPIR